MSIYLMWGMLLSLLGLMASNLAPDLRKIALLSGVAATPFGLLDLFFVYDYWDPGHVIEPAFSIEGMLFSFGYGVFAWLVAILPFRGALSCELNPRLLCLRYACCSALALGIMFSLWSEGVGLTDVSLMQATFVALVVVGGAMFLLRRDLLPIAVSGALSFGGIYTLSLFVLSKLAPDFSMYWYAANQDGLKLFGYPLKEVIWAVLYGAVWNTGIAFGCDVRIKSPVRPYLFAAAGRRGGSDGG